MTDVARDETEKVDPIEHNEVPFVLQTSGMQPPVYPTTALASAFVDVPKFKLVRKFWRLFLTGCAVSLGGMYGGYCLAAVGNIVANQGFINQFGTVVNPTTGALELDSTYVSLWSAAIYIGQTVCQFISPVTADRFGRRCNLWLLAGFMGLAIILECVAKNWKVYFAAKILAGCTCAFYSTGVVLYMSEIALPGFRGAMLSSFALSYSLGQLFSAIGLEILNETAPLEFRRAFYSEFVLLGLICAVFVTLPESPYWLAEKGKHDKAKRALRRLVGNVEGYDVDREYNVILQEIEASKVLTSQQNSPDAGWSAMLKPANMKRTVIAALPLMYQNFSGTALIFGYTTYFFQLAGLSDAFVGSVIVYVVLLVGILVSFYLVERVGRRTLVLGGGTVMSIVCIIIGGLGFLPATTGYGAGLITLCSIWVFAYSLSLAPVGWITIVEIPSQHLRAKTSSVAQAGNIASGVLFAYTVPLMLSDQDAGWGTHIGFFYGGICALMLIPIYFLLPETKGRSYAELDELFARGISPRKFKTTLTSVQTDRMEADEDGLKKV